MPIARYARATARTQRLTHGIGAATIATKLARSSSTKTDPVVGPVSLDPVSEGLPLGTHITATSELRADWRGGAVVFATITVVPVSIVTGFNTGSDLTVAATSRNAVIETGVRLHRVGIVAGFDTSLHVTIAATSRNAGVQATIGLRLISVVACLDTCPNVTVTTAWRRAVV